MPTSARIVLWCVRVLCAPAAAAGGMLAGAILGALLHSLLNLSATWDEPLTGACAAFLFVICGAIAAPGHKIIAGVILFAVGDYIAWHFVSWHHPITYEPTVLPFALTTTGGLLALPPLLLFQKLEVSLRRANARWLGLCPLCGYDLHGLPQARCPECGR